MRPVQRLLRLHINQATAQLTPHLHQARPRPPKLHHQRQPATRHKLPRHQRNHPHSKRPRRPRRHLTLPNIPHKRNLHPNRRTKSPPRPRAQVLTRRHQSQAILPSRTVPQPTRRQPQHPRPEAQHLSPNRRHQPAPNQLRVRRRQHGGRAPTPVPNALSTAAC